VATKQEIEVGTKKVLDAKKNGIPIVSEQFLHDCIEKKKLLSPKNYLLQ
jgi:hypothetical protein